jgi:hypothetical protein
MTALLTHQSIAGKLKQVKCHAGLTLGHQVRAIKGLFWLEKGQGGAPAALSKAAGA